MNNHMHVIFMLQDKFLEMGLSGQMVYICRFVDIA